MISLTYILVFLVLGEIPWIIKGVQENFGKIGKIKLSLTSGQLCKKRALPLLPLLDYVYSLDFEQEPNYGKMRHILVSILIEQNKVPTKMFEWSQWRNNRRSHNEMQINRVKNNLEDKQID